MKSWFGITNMGKEDVADYWHDKFMQEANDSVDCRNSNVLVGT